MLWILVLLAGWCLVPFPVAVLVGRFAARSTTTGAASAVDCWLGTFDGTRAPA